MVPTLQIKRSMEVVRGKNDKVDAARIAEYAYLYRDKLQEGGYEQSMKKHSLVHKKGEAKILLTHMLNL